MFIMHEQIIFTELMPRNKYIIIYNVYNTYYIFLLFIDSETKLFFIKTYFK